MVCSQAIILTCVYPELGGTLGKHWSYHKTTYLPHEGYLNLIAYAPDCIQCSHNPTGTKDAINKIFIKDWMR